MEDKVILEKFRNESSKHEAFSLLMDKYQQRIYWLIRKMVIDHDDANDLAQDVFVKVWKNLGGFKAESQLYTWIYRIAVNESLTFLKKKRQKYFFSLDDVEQELSTKIDTNSNLGGDEIQKRLQKALIKLPDKQRLVFNLKYFEEMKYEEIAEITETSVGALKASYHHAVKKIEELIQDD